jgi:5'-AMP-activated protein kinase regulatory beta subunit
VEGSFDNWTTRQPLQHTGKDWTIIKLLPPGVYQVRRTSSGRHRLGSGPLPAAAP